MPNRLPFIAAVTACSCMLAAAANTEIPLQFFYMPDDESQGTYFCADDGPGLNPRLAETIPENTCFWTPGLNGNGKQPAYVGNSVDVACHVFEGCKGKHSGAKSSIPFSACTEATSISLYKGLPAAMTGGSSLCSGNFGTGTGVPTAFPSDSCYYCAPTGSKPPAKPPSTTAPYSSPTFYWQDFADGNEFCYASLTRNDHVQQDECRWIPLRTKDNPPRPPDWMGFPIRGTTCFLNPNCGDRKGHPLPDKKHCSNATYWDTAPKPGQFLQTFADPDKACIGHTSSNIPFPNNTCYYCHHKPPPPVPVTEVLSATSAA